MFPWIIFTWFVVCFLYLCFQFYVFPSKQLYQIVSTSITLPLSLHTTYNETIPHLIFQTWKSKTDMPVMYREFSQIIQEMNPSFTHVLWDDQENANFIQNEYPWFYSTYQNYDRPIKRVDAIRYFFLYHYGGVYMDMDSITLKPLSPLLHNRSLVFGYQDKHHSQIPNAFMATAPRHPFFEYLLKMLPKTQHLDVLHATGPEFLKTCLRQWKLEEKSVLPFPVLYTHAWNEKPQISTWPSRQMKEWRQTYPTSYVTTFWTSSWKK